MVDRLMSCLRYTASPGLGICGHICRDRSEIVLHHLSISSDDGTDDMRHIVQVARIWEE